MGKSNRKLSPDRWITSVFKHPDRRYFVRCIDAFTATPHYFFIMPNGLISVPSTRIDQPGKPVSKKDLPHRIRKAIITHLLEIEEAVNQSVMKI